MPDRKDHASYFNSKLTNCIKIIHEPCTYMYRLVQTYLNLPSLTVFLWRSSAVISFAVNPSELMTSQALISTQHFPLPDWDIPNNDIPPFSCVTNAVLTPSSSDKGGVSLWGKPKNLMLRSYVAKCNLGEVWLESMLVSGLSGWPCAVGSHTGFCRAYMFCLPAV